VSSAWRNELVARAGELGRWVRGRVVLEPGSSDELVSTRSFMDTVRLRGAIERSISVTAPPGSHSDHPDAELALGVAASRFTRHYSASLTAAAIVGLSRGIGLDLSVDRCTMIVRHNVPFCLVLDVPGGPAAGRGDELRARVWHSLYAAHLWPVFERAIEVTNGSAALMWTNAAEWVGLILEAAGEYLDPAEAAPIIAECRALLDAPTLPGLPGNGNPLSGKLDWEPGDGKGFPGLVQTRKLCCLTYLLGDRLGRLCQNCPYLSLAERIALVRERHGVPLGTAGGAAERQSIERGLALPSTRRASARRQRDLG
jgi:ferric iron reductase protein FhuF